jgi:Domain of unknown function (DUF5123)/Domain of unknown function (DUF4957)/Tissue factor
MMKKIRNSLSGVLTGALLVLLVASCQKHYDPNFSLPRQFKPGDITVTAGETSATLTWLASLFAPHATSYTVQVSQDSTFAGTVVFTATVTSPTVVVTDSVLKVRQPYFARVKANTNGSTTESGWVTSSRFSITGEQIFLSLSASDIIDNGVRLKWKTTAGLTNIVITPLNGTPFTVNLTPADITAEQKIISGLSANTNYSAEIFIGTKSKGYVTFTTAAPLSGNLVDLRNITGRPSVLSDTLPLIPDNSIVILKRGDTYTISATLNLGRSVKIISGADLANPNQAIISLPANFNVTAGSTIDHFDFQDVALIATDYTAKYVFNISNACTINRIDFESCRIEKMRGVCRLQAATIAVSNYIVNNCIIDSISNYGIITIDAATCKADNISIKNSTIYKTERGVINTKQTLGSTSVVIDNCTFNEAPFGNQTASFFVDYSTFNVTNGISITNCIFGRGKINGTSIDVRDVRAGTSTTITSSNNYITTDHIVVASPLTPVIAYSGTSFALWQDPLNGNFKFADNGFAGKNTAGDPRWR